MQSASRVSNLCNLVNGDTDCQWRHKNKNQDENNVDGPWGAVYGTQVGKVTAVFYLHRPQSRSCQDINPLCAACKFFL